ncbi:MULTISPECIES: helix-turn-helix transcriptional regulator [Ruminococcus]|jgi:transcriptional regulator with XRE-family HTH domain|uniref:helix-turn-helix domain-containing protein n=1 Tax=Ruminococcus TaxID=1263 RepID=UPI001B72860A|nr:MULTISPECIES: helix-turn-helix transcriptional regulator [Ruminococcus]MBP5430797.1 helix-turn-helix transcriptional regulator [Ruminococcus sp.]
MTFAERLKQLRLEKGYTQEELAKLVNVSQPSYWAYENKDVIPYKNTQIQLAKVLGVTVEELMNGEERSR